MQATTPPVLALQPNPLDVNQVHHLLVVDDNAMNQLVVELMVHKVLPLAVVHTLGNTFTNMSLGKVAVSFTHTIKAMEPFFSVLLSALVLGDVRSSLLWSPEMGGGEH
jgi:hypothetical protein